MSIAASSTLRLLNDYESIVWIQSIVRISMNITLETTTLVKPTRVEALIYRIHTISLLHTEYKGTLLKMT